MATSLPLFIICTRTSSSQKALMCSTVNMLTLMFIIQSYCCKVDVTSPLLHESPEVDQNGICHVGNINVSSTITVLHLEMRVVTHPYFANMDCCPVQYLQSPTGILEEQCDRAIVHVFSTPQLSWLDLTVRWEGRVVEETQCGVAVVWPKTHLAVSLDKVLGVLGIVVITHIVHPGEYLLSFQDKHFQLLGTKIYWHNATTRVHNDIIFDVIICSWLAVYPNLYPRLGLSLTVLKRRRRCIKQTSEMA